MSFLNGLIAILVALAAILFYILILRFLLYIVLIAAGVIVTAVLFVGLFKLIRKTGEGPKGSEYK